jgi:hypothetical protein
MCRTIKKLRGQTPEVTDADIQAAARQYIRKVSGYQAFPKGRQVELEEAVTLVAQATRELLDKLK